STGFEVEMAMSPVRDLNFNFGVTYAKTKYANNLVGSSSGAPLDPALRLLPGQLLSNAPEWVVTSSAGWTPSLGGSLRGLLYVDARLADRYNT
ncbi:TonB-dependent receptor, partial [Escherichia coli]|nr:TonB-dependent receptor [Escherichia coli]